MNLIEAFNTRKRGAMIKDTHFFDIYESHFSSIQNEKLRILEIGVYNGGSLYMWKNYFPNAEIIVGIDIDDYCKQFESKEDNIIVELGDQSNTEFLKTINEHYGPFDIIIDDGGHENYQIITSLTTLFPLLKIGGYYVIEDVSHAYWPDYDCDRDKSTLGTPINIIKKKNSTTSMEFLKLCTDCLNVWAYKNNPEAGKFEKGVYPDDFESHLFSIHFYDNIVFLQKFERPKDLRYGKPKFWAEREKIDY